MPTGESFVYLEIAEAVRRLIVSGQLQPGDRLPSVRVMAEPLGMHAQHGEPGLFAAFARGTGDGPSGRWHPSSVDQGRSVWVRATGMGVGQPGQSGRDLPPRKPQSGSQPGACRGGTVCGHIPLAGSSASGISTRGCGFCGSAGWSGTVRRQSRPLGRAVGTIAPRANASGDLVARFHRQSGRADGASSGRSRCCRHAPVG